MGNIYHINQHKTAETNSIIQQLKQNKNNYFELDKKVRYRYDTIQAIFSFFQDDYEFLIAIFDDISLNVQEDWILEFLLLTASKLENIPNIPIEKYIHNPSGMPNSNTMALLRVNLLLGIQKEKILRTVKLLLNEAPNYDLGVGFCFIEKHFHYSDVIKKHFAHHFISEIFLDLDLEQHIHQNYNSYDEFESKTGVKAFTHNYISKRDTSLDYYTMNHPDCLEEIPYAFQYIKNNWDNYTRLQTEEIYEKIAFDINHYIVSFENPPYSIEEFRDIAFYASYRLGILDDFFRFLIGRDDEYLEIKAAECERWLNEENDMDSTIIYAQMKKIMHDSLNKITDCKYKQKVKAKQMQIQKNHCLS